MNNGAEPPKLARFKYDNIETPQVLRYHNLPSDVREELYASMLKEQGRLCAYTMLRTGRPSDIDRMYDFRIEHIQAQSTYPNLELDFHNMVLCAFDPKTNMEFGEPAKGDRAVTPQNFVWPTAPDCEQRFLFRGDGTIAATNDSDLAAKQTISTLRLDHRVLTNMRSATLRTLGLGTNAARPLSQSQAASLAASIVEANDQGEIPAFCIAIKQVAARLAGLGLGSD